MLLEKICPGGVGLYREIGLVKDVILVFFLPLLAENPFLSLILIENDTRTESLKCKRSSPAVAVSVISDHSARIQNTAVGRMCFVFSLSAVAYFGRLEDCGSEWTK